MEAIRKEKVKRIGSKITVELPDEFKAEEVDVIILPSKGDSLSIEKPIDVVEWRKDLIKEFSQFNVDLSNLKYTRDELYDRP